MTSIFVVVSQENSLTGAPSQPISAFPDYAAAMAFAQTIFTNTYDPGFTARDLVYMVNLITPAPVVPSVAVTV